MLASIFSSNRFSLDTHYAAPYAVESCTTGALIKPLLSALACFAIAIAVGCGSSSSPTTSFPSLNGNYQFQTVSTVNVGVTEIGGQFTESSGAVTGIVHVAGSLCIDFLTDIPVTGTIKKDGTLVVTSASIANQVVTINASVSADGSTISSGTYTVVGGCADKDKGTASGFRVPPINGTYTGTYTSTPTGTQIPTTIQVTQMPTADSHGFLHLAGSATFTSPCFSKGTVAVPVTDSVVLGATVGVTFKTDEIRGSTILAGGEVDPTGKILTGTYHVTGGACDGDLGVGTLTMQ